MRTIKPTWLEHGGERIPYTVVDTYVSWHCILYRPYPISDKTWNVAIIRQQKKQLETIGTNIQVQTRFTANDVAKKYLAHLKAVV